MRALREYRGTLRQWARGPGFPVLHKVFQIGIILKGFNALVELLSGAFLLMFSVERLRSIVHLVSSGQGGSWLRRLWPFSLYRLERWIAPDTKTFFTWFFLSHGAVKAFIIVCLLCGWIWAYPLGITVFSIFIVYQITEILVRHHPVLYFALSVIDAFVIALTVNEWRHAKLSAHRDDATG
jgi:uncharacterized membrane protein